MKKSILFMVMAIILFSCYTEKKASTQTSKALDKYPGVVANIARTAFPCAIKQADSTGYYSALREKDSLLNIIDTSTQSGRDLRAYLELLRGDSIAAKNCGELLKQVTSYSNGIEAKNATLLEAIKRLRNQPPAVINVPFEDSAKIYLAQQSASRQADSTGKYKALYNAEHTIRVEQDRMLRRGFVFPWWLVFTLIGLIGLVGYLKFKRIL